MELAGQLASGTATGRAVPETGAERGYAMAALLVGMSVMAVLMSAALPAWSHLAQRENEAELVWRGEQYARAIGLFQRKYANTFPPTVDVLVEQKFLRKKYKDPVTNDDFQIIPVGGAMPGQTGRAASGSGPPGGTGAGTGTSGGFGGATGGTTTGTGFGSAGGAGGARGGSAGSAGGLGSGSSGFGQQPGTAPTQGTQPGSAGLGQQGAAPLGVQGVTSKSKASSLRLYNGMDKYNQWAFVYVAVNTMGGAAGAGAGGNPNAPPGSPQNPANPFGGGPGGSGGFGGGGGFGTPVQPGGGPPPVFGPAPSGQPRMPPVGGGTPGPFGAPRPPQ